MTPRGALALALILAAPATGAVSLGEVEVRSYLGDKLDARIPVSPAAGESIRGACFSLSSNGTAGVPRISQGELLLQRSASGTYLRIRSTTPIEDPALAVGIVIACPGQAAQGTQEFSVLVDPRTRTTAPAVEAGPRASTAVAPPAASTRLGAREGDTLESIAHAIFPRDRIARGAYLSALRETNPVLASRGDREPIPANEGVALPDLRTFMQRRRSQPALAQPLPSASSELAAAAPAPRQTAPRPARRAAPARPAAPPAPTGLAEAPRSPPPVETRSREVPASAQRPVTERAVAPPPRTRTAAGGFQLKLSGGEVDLSRSNNIDDRSRAQLRERLLMLDADDQVAAMLSMRNSLKQLEARVAELQLKLAGMPPSLEGKGAPSSAAKPAPKAEPAPAKVAQELAPKVEAPKIEAPKIEPPQVEPPKVAAPPPKSETPSAQVEPAPAVAAAPAVEPATPSRVESATLPAGPRPARAIPRPAPDNKPSALPSWLWSVVALLVVLALLVAWLVLRRRRAAEESEDYADEEPPLAPAGEPFEEIAPESAPVYAEEPQPDLSPFPEEERRVVASDADLATRIPQENAAELRRRYMEERFPEITTRMIVLDDADSVVKGARLFYEDGAVPRAVELLQFALEAHPEQVKTWLALFEIFRLERLTGEFAALAQRFKAQHGESEHWRKVQFFGREIDPGNALYQDAPVNTLETIGPREARRLAAASSFDPIAENWLNAPMDFENEVLANELRLVLMQHAGLTEQDLVANPMPALRKLEMFNVA